MPVIGQGISLRGMIHEKSHYPFFLASGITRTDIGKAVAIDTSAANTVKLAGAGEQIIGRLVVVEDRGVEGVLVGTVETRGGFALPIADGSTVAVGDTVVGSATAGAVAAAATANHADNVVVEIDGTTAIILR